MQENSCKRGDSQGIGDVVCFRREFEVKDGGSGGNGRVWGGEIRTIWGGRWLRILRISLILFEKLSSGCHAQSNHFSCCFLPARGELTVSSMSWLVSPVLRFRVVICVFRRFGSPATEVKKGPGVCQKVIYETLIYYGSASRRRPALWFQPWKYINITIVLYSLRFLINLILA